MYITYPRFIQRTHTQNKLPRLSTNHHKTDPGNQSAQRASPPSPTAPVHLSVSPLPQLLISIVSNSCDRRLASRDRPSHDPALRHIALAIFLHRVGEFVGEVETVVNLSEG